MKTRAPAGRQLLRNTTTALATCALVTLSAAPALARCTTRADGTRLIVVGDRNANAIEIVGVDGRVQVSCDHLLRAAGPIALAAHPGDGFDTARVTRDLLPYVAAFETVESIELAALGAR